MGFGFGGVDQSSLKTKKLQRRMCVSICCYCCCRASSVNFFAADQALAKDPLVAVKADPGKSA